ncbi:GroES-like protein [Mycena filopes]|nr:GroES-like protein [Mycena filopes]
MSTQQAVVLETPKGPFVLRSRPVPSPAKGKLLLKIMSVGLNPINWKQAAFNMLIDEYPAVIGNDVAGVVEELGEGVEGFKKGDRVLAQTLDGAFQQYFAIPAAIAIRFPEDRTFDEMATFPVAFSTACVLASGSIPHSRGTSRSKAMLPTSLASELESTAIQLLKFLGFTRIVAYASNCNFEVLTQFGATECVDRLEVPVDSVGAHPALTHRVDVVYDAGSVSSFSGAYDALVEGGKIVITQPHVQLDRDPAQKDLTLFRRDDVLGHLAVPEHTVFGKLIIENLPKMLAKGVISGNRCEYLPNGLAGISEGLERLKNGSVSGVKLVAHPHDPIV